MMNLRQNRLEVNMENSDLHNDWRIMNQEKYLSGKHLRFRNFVKASDWEHEHCCFCTKKIMEDCQDIDDCTTSGYSTLDNYYWICADCYADFKEKFKWILVD